MHYITCIAFGSLHVLLARLTISPCTFQCVDNQLSRCSSVAFLTASSSSLNCLVDEISGLPRTPADVLLKIRSPESNPFHRNHQIVFSKNNSVASFGCLRQDHVSNQFAPFFCIPIHQMILVSLLGELCTFVPQTQPHNLITLTPLMLRMHASVNRFTSWGDDLPYVSILQLIDFVSVSSFSCRLTNDFGQSARVGGTHRQIEAKIL